MYGELRHDQAPQFALVQLFVHTGARGSEICIYIYCTFMAVFGFSICDCLQRVCTSLSEKNQILSGDVDM